MATSRLAAAGAMKGAFEDLMTTEDGVSAHTAGHAAMGLDAALKRGGSRLLPGTPIVRSPANTTGILVSPNMTITATTRRGRKCWEVVWAAEATNKSVYFPITSGTYTDKTSIVFEVEDAAEWNGGSWRLAYFTDINLNVGMRSIQSVGTSSGYDGLHVLAPLASEWAAVSTGSWSSTMTYCAFQGVRKASPTVTTKVWIYEITHQEKQSLPMIIFGADDGHGTWYSDGLPILEKYGFKSYMAYIHDSALAGGSSMTVSQWQDAVERGHYAVVHGPKTGKASLRDYFSNYTGYNSPGDAIKADIEYNRDGMVANGLDDDGRGRQIYVYPQGYHQPASGAGDDTISGALSSLNFKMGRIAATQNSILVNGGGRGMMMYLPIIGHSWAGASEATNISALVTAMQDEVNAGRPVIFMFHQVAASPSIAEEITAANLTTLVSAANTLVQSGAARRGDMRDLMSEFETYNSPVHYGA